MLQRLACALVLLSGWASDVTSLHAQTARTNTRPQEGLRENTPAVFALTDARIVVAPGRVIPRGSVVVRDGAIVAVGDSVELPADARRIDLTGKSIYAGLIDAFSEVSLDGPTRGAVYWNSQITPQRSVASRYRIDKELNKKLRKQGVTAQLVAPQGGIIKGTSALVLTGEDHPSEAILKGDVAQHIRLTVSRGRSRREYPNSPMGAVALARQAMYDAQWYRRAWAAYRVDTMIPRPERNDALLALQAYPEQGLPVVVDASNELFFLRADRFAREFGLPLIVRGSGHEYRRLEAIRRTGAAVLLPVNFPKPPNVGTAEAARNVDLEDLLHWDLAPENPARLAEADVRFALTSYGLKDRGQFLARVRQAVRRGLPADKALEALTTTPAELLDITASVGVVEPGKLANLVVTDGELFAEDGKVLETWVRGVRHQIVTPPLMDMGGSWQVRLARSVGGHRSFRMQLKADGEDVSGTLHLEGEKESIALTHAARRDGRFSCTFSGKEFGHEGVVRLTAVVQGTEREAGRWTGQIIWPDGGRTALTARRGGEPAEEEAEEEESPEDSSSPDGDGASFAVNFPLGAFGREGPPDQPTHVLFRGATIWTCGPAGKLENASLLIGRGKVIAVGTEIDAPAGALVIDAKGKHITPGIIDCHSHMATDGGVNESTQAITAEVRIGDFIDADDIDIYRQLAGGVTSSNILHGSANPIGGQNQVIKLRWGGLPEQLKFAEAPSGIKFALGENVKQSNWGDDYTTRYPQTRMGVEQLIRDAFQAARAYRDAHERWDAEHRGLPPRRDLELEALAEVLAGTRWIHCHSYRQDEILALIRTLDGFGVTIGTFQHILEGYKVADAMAQHGAMGSAFSDWWAYKFEVYDAIPFAGALMHDAGVVVSFNSDDQELARHLNHEAAKAQKYGGVPAEQALNFVTINPAMQLRIDDYVGSLVAGKHADLVVWSDDPLSILARCEQTWIDGRKYFDLAEDRRARQEVAQRRATLIQKVLKGSEGDQEGEDPVVEDDDWWPRYDAFCRCQEAADRRP